jgi:hypothetical protein
MINCLKTFILYFFLLGILANCDAQYAISNGVSLPSSDTVRVLIVFAQVDYSTGGCPQNLPDNIDGDWPVNIKGVRQPPSDADTYFDFKVTKGEEPKGYITDYYYQASFGKYVLLGDYYPEVITVPCNKVKIGNDGLHWILDSLKRKKSNDSTLYSFHGLPLSSFDNWTITDAGLPKIKKTDGKIDLLYIIWRNNRFLGGASTKDNSGFGVHVATGIPFQNMKGVNNVTSFNAGHSGGHGYFITIAEHLHAIFGGNNWHTAGGRGDFTTLFIANCYGVTGQYFATMQAPCGWDRWMMNWKNPDKNYLISSLDENKTEINTENISLDSTAKGGTYILRDFMTTGDALRIKLPHLNWMNYGDVKNQYLWIENRRMNTKYDVYYSKGCSDDDNGKFPQGTPGIYSYIQVGKDIKKGGAEIYSYDFAMPDALGGFLFPLTAEGNYDFYYAWDRVQEPNASLCGNWGNRNLPVDVSRSKPNPFTGFSDLYDYVDFNNNGKFYSGDTVQPGLSKIIGDSVYHNYNSNGDWKDAFCSATGNTELSLSSNPAAVPVYTLCTNYEARKAYLPKGNYASFENRTIWLNGLSVKLIQESVFGNGEIKVQVRFDDYDVNKNVRWCGNIVLSKNDFYSLKPSLILKQNKKILLDRGYSSTNFKAVEKNNDGRWLFSDTTKFTCLSNSSILMEQGSQLVLDNGSIFILKKGSKLELVKKSKIILKNNSQLVVEDGASLILGPKCRIIKKSAKQ